MAIKEYLRRVFPGTAEEFCQKAGDAMVSGKRLFVVTANPEILMHAGEDPAIRQLLLAEERRLKHMVGNVLSSDVFYSAHPERTDLWRPMGVLCVEMEISALYANAAFAGKHALGILSISDVIGKNEEMTPEERQTKFTNMMELALDTVTGL